MKNLGKDIERIKQMMKTINEGSFDEPTESEVPLDVRQESTKIINNFIQNPEIVDYEVKGYSGWFAIGGEPVDKGEPEYLLTYNFEINITRHSSFTSGRYGSYDDSYPDEGENAEYDLEITSVELIEGITDLNDEYSHKVIYNGPDFTGIMDIKLSNGDMSSDFIRNEMDETIQDEEYNNEQDEESDYINESINPTKKIMNGIFRKLGIKTLTTQSSGMVRGWTTYHGKGYKYEYSGLVSLKGFTEEEMKDIAKQFEEAGIKVNRIYPGGISYTEIK
jgi:hypothetical protein